MKTACRLLSHPEKKQNTIHITGTNGKGSTAAFLSSILQNSGLKVGTFTISQKIISKIKDKIQPTIFEFLALVALYYFAETKLIDLVIYEVGLGGKYDATNVILPLVCGITNIDYDHSQYLGNTLTSIAEEKSGIIKKNIPCFTTETRPQILSLFRNVAQKKQSKIYKISSPKRFTFASNESVMYFCLATKGYTFNLKTKMLGHYQIKNISLAIHIALYLQKYFPQITQNSIEEDGAHNQAGIKHLVQTIKTFFPAKQPIFLVSIMKDKQVNKMLNALKEVAYQIIFTEMPGSRKQEVSPNGGMVDAWDLRSHGVIRAGSSPALGTKDQEKELKEQFTNCQTLLEKKSVKEKLTPLQNTIFDKKKELKNSAPTSASSSLKDKKNLDKKKLANSLKTELKKELEQRANGT
ncbi:7935_t:CDS:2 [Entrophospora sp. SA101]|nr:7935_t:CDS:2 [Entrophospora sp. SA101]